MDTNIPPGAISSINGMRVLSMWWVILGHVYAIQQITPISKCSYFSDWLINVIDNNYQLINVDI